MTVHSDAYGTPDAVDVRDTLTGALVRTLTVPGLVKSVAIDTRRHRGFIAVQNCKAPAADPFGWLPGWLRRSLLLPVTAPAVLAYRGCIVVLDTAR